MCRLCLTSIWDAHSSSSHHQHQLPMRPHASHPHRAWLGPSRRPVTDVCMWGKTVWILRKWGDIFCTLLHISSYVCPGTIKPCLHTILYLQMGTSGPQAQLSHQATRISQLLASQLRKWPHSWGNGFSLTPFRETKTKCRDLDLSVNDKRSFVIINVTCVAAFTTAPAQLLLSSFFMILLKPGMWLLFLVRCQHQWQSLILLTEM